MKTINNIHVICKGIILSILLHMFVVGFVVITGFNTSVETFTGVLLISMAVASFFVGTISDRYAEINGILVALIVSGISLLYISLYAPMDWKVNQIIIACYIVIGFVFSLLSRLTNKKFSKDNKISKPKKVKEQKSPKILPSNATELSTKATKTEVKKHVSKKSIKKNARLEKDSSDQFAIRQDLLKEIEREKAIRKNKKR